MFRIFLNSSHPVLQRLYSHVKKTGVFGLSDQEITHLREVWKVVEQAPLPVSKLFFKNLFEAKPEYKKKFGKQVGGGTSLIHNNDFIADMRAVVSSLNSIIRKLEDEKSVNQVMEYIAESHKGHDIHREELVEIGKSVKEVLKELNQRKFNNEMEAAFDKFWAAFSEDYVRRINKGTKKPVKPRPKK